MIEKLKYTLSFLWRWSLMLTVPVGSAFLVWAYRTGTKYEDLGVKFETFNNYMTLHRIGSFEAQGVVRDVELALRPREFDDAPKLRTIELYIPEASERQLNSELPHTGREYVPAALQYPDGSIGEVKLRYRGDHFWHWGARKKSLRVKTKKSQLFERTRALNFSAPKTKDQIVEQLSNELALRFDLIGPESELVNVSVNGRNRGLHVLVEQLEEMVIRKNGKMPGDLYAADIVKRSAFAGLSTMVFQNAALWEKSAINNHFDPPVDVNLRRLVDVLEAEPSIERTRTLRELVDIEAFGRFAAFRTVCQTFHFDDHHNQRLYYDPWRNHFLPVVWDSVGWHPGALPRRGEKARADVVTSDLDKALFQDPAFLAARQRAFEDWFSSGKHEDFLERVDELIAQTSPSLDRDPGLGAMLTLMSPDEVRRAQAKIREQIIQIGRDVRSFYMGKPEIGYVVNDENPSSIRLRAGNHAVIQGVEMSFEEPLDGRVDAFVSYYSANGEAMTTDVSAKVELRGTKLRLNVPFGAQILHFPEEVATRIQRNYTTVEPATYQISLRGGGVEENRLLRLSSFNSLDQVTTAKRVRAIEPAPFVITHEAVVPAPVTEPIHWSGEMVIEDIRRIENDVIVAPGTVIKMGPGASVVITGQLIARGTKAEPIVVGPLREDQEPWGTLAVRSPRADQSHISWMEMRKGSGLKEPEAEFSAMLSIHDVDDIVVEDCLFEDSRIVDDMVHAVYSTIRFERCTFVRSLMDALDIDISEAIVSECTFIESGNDSLDLMTSTVVAVDVTTLRSGDKGVSVGEDTTAMLLRCRLIDGLIGAEMKDRSKSIILNSEIRGNGKGIHAYKKNWRYDSGGFTNIYNSIIENNKMQFGADKYSRAKVHDSFIRPKPELGKKEAARIQFDRWCDHTSRTKARLNRPFQFPGEAESSPSMFLPFWSAARPEIRGPGVEQ